MGSITFLTYKPAPPSGNLFLPAYGSLSALNATDNAATPPLSLTDDNSGTFVTMDNSPIGSVQIEFDKAYPIQRLRFRGTGGYYGTGFNFYASNTGVFSGEETLVKTYTGPTYEIYYNWREWFFTNTTSYKYYRLYPISNQFWRLSELKLYTDRTATEWVDYLSNGYWVATTGTWDNPIFESDVSGDLVLISHWNTVDNIRPEKIKIDHDSINTVSLNIVDTNSNVIIQENDLTSGQEYDLDFSNDLDIQTITFDTTAYFEVTDIQFYI